MQRNAVTAETWFKTLAINFSVKMLSSVCDSTRVSRARLATATGIHFRTSGAVASNPISSTDMKVQKRGSVRHVTPLINSLAIGWCEHYRGNPYFNLIQQRFAFHVLRATLNFTIAPVEVLPLHLAFVLLCT